jgi:hypothetical protein
VRRGRVLWNSNRCLLHAALDVDFPRQHKPGRTPAHEKQVRFTPTEFSQSGPVVGSVRPSTAISAADFASVQLPVSENLLSVNRLFPFSLLVTFPFNPFPQKPDRVSIEARATKFACVPSRYATNRFLNS